jgi:hypothetical protein
MALTTMVVRFLDIGGIVDNHCLNFLCFLDIGGIVDNHCLNFLFINRRCIIKMVINVVSVLLLVSVIHD